MKELEREALEELIRSVRPIIATIETLTDIVSKIAYSKSLLKAIEHCVGAIDNITSVQEKILISTEIPEELD